jgi:hypothetical protein
LNAAIRDRPRLRSCDERYRAAASPREFPGLNGAAGELGLLLPDRGDEAQP